MPEQLPKSFLRFPYYTSLYLYKNVVYPKNPVLTSKARMLGFRGLRGVDSGSITFVAVDVRSWYWVVAKP